MSQRYSEVISAFESVAQSSDQQGKRSQTKDKISLMTTWLSLMNCLGVRVMKIFTKSFNWPYSISVKQPYLVLSMEQLLAIDAGMGNKLRIKLKP